MPDLQSHLDLGVYALGIIDDAERKTFEHHLLTCEQCQLELQELTDLKSALAELATNPVPAAPDRLRERITDSVKTAIGLDSSDVPSTDSGRHPRILAIGSVVVAVVALLAAALTTGGGRDGVVGMALVVPETTIVVGSVTISGAEGGRDVRLKLDKIEPTTAADHYECWFVAEGGDSIDAPNRVSVGTFAIGESGSAEVRMSALADGGFSTLAITREPRDGNPNWTGPTVAVSSTDL